MIDLARFGNETWARLPVHLRAEALQAMGIEPVIHVSGLVIGHREVLRA